MEPNITNKPKKRPSVEKHWNLQTGYLILKSLCDEFNLTLVKEFRFCPIEDKLQRRRYRFDYCIVELKMGVEFDGGIWSNKPSHSSSTGITRDIEKGNYAQLCGYSWYRFTYQQSKTYLYDTIKQAITNKLNTNQ